MRRALLTARAQALPVHVGNSALLSNTNNINSGSLTRVTVNLGDPADATGTLTTVSLKMTENSTTRDGHVMVGTLAGTTYTVRAITGIINFTSNASGLAVATISLPIVAGDLIGLWTNNVLPNQWVRMSADTGSTTGYTPSGPTTAPNPGDTITLTTQANRRLNIYAEG